MSETIFNITAQLYGLSDISTDSSTLTMVCIDCVNTTQVPVVPKKNILSGILTRDEYKDHSHIFTWIKAIAQPISILFLILSAVVFLRRGMRNSSTGLLVTLNLAEAYNVTNVSIYQICKLSDSCFDAKVYAIFVLYSTTYLGIACRRSVYLFNCLVAVQRFLVVAFPIRSKNWKLLHRPKTISVMVLGIMLVAHVYIPIKYEVGRVGSHYRTIKSQLALDHEAVFKAVTTANICITSYLPVMVGLFANIGMGMALWLHSRSMSHMDKTGKQQRRGKKHSQTTFTVLASTLLFFIFALPSTANHLVMETRTDYGPRQLEKYLYFTLSEGFVLCQIVSDMVVFFSYVCVGSAFREHLRAIFCGRCKKTSALRNINSFHTRSVSEYSVHHIEQVNGNQRF